MRKHGVEIARRNAGKQARTAHDGQRFGVRPVRLGDNPDAPAVGFQHTADHRRAERRMIDIRVAGDDQHIELVPPARVHFGLRHR